MREICAFDRCEVLFTRFACRVFQQIDAAAGNRTLEMPEGSALTADNGLVPLGFSEFYLAKLSQGENAPRRRAARRARLDLAY